MRSSLTTVLSPCVRRWVSYSPVVLSGHNKWSKIKERKGAADKKKSDVYGRAGRDIAIAARIGGSADPNLNTILANALKKAKVSGVPKENIEKALARVSGENGKDGNTYVMYEAMVSGSVGVLIECFTDNVNRTIREIRDTLKKHNGRLAPVSYLFEKIGRAQVKVPVGTDRDGNIEAMLVAAEAAGGEDFEIIEDSDIVEYYCPTDDLDAMTKAISGTEKYEELVSSEWIYRAKEEAKEVDKELEENIVDLKGALLGEDCVRVWTTIDSHIRDEDDE